MYKFIKLNIKLGYIFNFTSIIVGILLFLYSNITQTTTFDFNNIISYPGIVSILVGIIGLSINIFAHMSFKNIEKELNLNTINSQKYNEIKSSIENLNK